MEPEKALSFLGKTRRTLHSRNWSWIHSRHSRYVSLLGSRNRFEEEAIAMSREIAKKKGFVLVFLLERILPLRKNMPKNPKKRRYAFVRYRRAVCIDWIIPLKVFLLKYETPFFHPTAFLFPWDVVAGFRNDPALRGKWFGALELFTYPGLWAIFFHRVAHLLFGLYIPSFPEYSLKFLVSHRNRNPSRRKN